MGWNNATYLAPTALILAAALIGAGCSRQARTPQVNPVAACGADPVLAQLKQALLPAPSFADSRYLDTVQRARIALSDLRLAGFNPEAGASNCTATAHLMARDLPQDAATTLQISYTAGRGPDGQVYVNGLEAMGGAELDQFAKLLQPSGAAHVVAAAPKPSAPPPPPEPPKPETQNSLGNSTGTSPGNSAGDSRPGLSDEAQQLVDQAGDTRASGDAAAVNNTSSPQPNGMR
jgi:hypothetical protein